MIKCRSYTDYCHSFYGAFYSFLYVCTSNILLNIDITLNYASLMGSDVRILISGWNIALRNSIYSHTNKAKLILRPVKQSLPYNPTLSLLVWKRCRTVLWAKEVKLEEKQLPSTKPLFDTNIFIYIYLCRHLLSWSCSQH